METTTCATCDGLGFVLSQDYDGFRIDWVFSACPECRPVPDPSACPEHKAGCGTQPHRWLAEAL